jgi:ABC-type phosphate transport system substrate-binding protein
MIIRVCTALTIAILIAGCGKSPENQQSETATSGSFQLVADEALRPVVDSLVGGFMKEYSQAKITVKYVSAGEAIRELMNKDARAVIIDRGLTPTERAVLQRDSMILPEFAMAEDGIGCIVSQKNPMGALAMSDLRAILMGKARTWPELTHSLPKPSGSFVNGGDITMVFSGYPSSMEYALDSIGMGPDQVTKGHIIRYETMDSVVARVKQDPNAIGFIGSSWKHWLEASGDTSVNVLPIIPADSSSRGITQPIILHMAYIYQGLYPLTTTVTGYTLDLPNTLPRGFFVYAMTAHGQTVFKNFDVLPKTQIIHIVPSR